MIVDAQQLAHDSEIRGRIAIIGAGAAGITLALELSKHFSDVLLLESGGLEFEQDTQDLYKGRVVGQSIDLAANTTGLPLDAARLRYFGGTTNHWTGYCTPYDATDFERIEDQPYSGWPFRLDDLIPFYERAYFYCEIGPYQQRSQIIGAAESLARQILNSSDFELTELRRSPPTRFGERYRAELVSSDRVKVYLHANVVDISIVSNGKAISSIDVRSLNGRNLKVTASAYILCCGGIENARILLNCTHHFPKGIGNQHDLVGRFFMNNPLAAVGKIVPRDPSFDLGPFALGYDGSVPVVVGFKNSEKIATRPGRRGAGLFLVPIFTDTRKIVGARSSPSFEAVRTMLHDVKHARIPVNFTDKTCTALEDPASIAVATYFGVSDFLWKKKQLESIFVRIEGVQYPNPESRVTLYDDIDALGVRRAALDWRISDEDYDNLYQTSIAFARGVGAAGFGRMNLEIEAAKDSSKVTGTGHHMGTTRMHYDSRQGVVDQNCRVHGLNNFYIAGSSVFPTCPRGNPTLTIVALALRLSDHLYTKLTTT